MPRLVYAALVLAACCSTARVRAQDGDDVGFGASSPEPSAAVPEIAPPPASSLSVTGFFRSDWALWAERINDQPLAEARQSVDVSVHYSKAGFRLVGSAYAARDLAYEVDRAVYDDSTLEVYESQILLKETYIAQAWEHFDLAFGNQVTAWGQGDVLSPLDVPNPQDQREPGSAVLSDLRMPVWSSRASWFSGAHRLEARVVHEGNYGLRSPVFGPFNPLASLFGGSLESAAALNPALAADDVHFDDAPEGIRGDTQQLFVRWDYAGQGIDLGLYAGSALDQFGVVTGLTFEDHVVTGSDGMTDAMTHSIHLQLEHPRYTVVGNSGNVPLGSWQIKWEMGGYLSRSYNVGAVDPAALELNQAKSHQLFAMGGIVFSGIEGTDIVLEAVYNYLTHRSLDLLFPFDEPAFGMRTRHAFLRDTLVFDTAALAFGGRLQAGWLARAQVDYALTDNFHVGVGYITYQPGSEFGFISGFSRHDRVLMRLRYDFSL